MTEGLLRQRRNLFLACIIIIFLRFGGVVIKKVSLFGTELDFENIEVFYAAVWTFFFYALIRYTQYFLQEPERGIADEFWSKMNALCFPILRKESARQHPSSKNYGGDFKLSKLNRVPGFKCEGYVVVNIDESGQPFNERYQVSLWRCAFPSLLSIFHVVALRSHITDYILPFLLATFTFLYGFAGEWNGSLINVITVFFSS